MLATIAIALRQLRGSWRSFFFFTLAIFLGVTAVVGVWSAAEQLRNVVRGDAQALLGGDFRIQAYFPLQPWADKHLKKEGRTLSHSLEFIGNVMGSDKSLLVEVKAVDGSYPLKGAIQLAGRGEVFSGPQPGEVWVDRGFISRTGFSLHDTFTLGKGNFTIGGIIEKEPDRIAGGFVMAPRLMISFADAHNTGLIQFGSRVLRVVLIAGGAGEDLDELEGYLNSKVKVVGYRLLTPEGSQPRQRKQIRRLTLFFDLTSLLTLLLACVAMAGNLTTFVRENRMTLAVYKCVGATRLQLGSVMFFQVLIMALIGIVAGGVAGVFVPDILLNLMGLEKLANAGAGFPIKSVGQGMSIGLISCLLFALIPIMAAGQTPIGLLLRSGDNPGQWRWQGISAWLAFVVGLVFAVLLAALAGEWRLGAISVVAVIALLAVIGSTVWLLVKLFALLKPSNPAIRLGMVGIIRPDSSTISNATALGLGLAVVMTVFFLEYNMQYHMEKELPKRAPGFFFLNIMPDQAEQFKKMGQKYSATKEGVRIVATARSRLSKINDKSISEHNPDDPSLKWRVHHEYPLAIHKNIPKGNVLISGRWWKEGEMGVSLEVRMANDLGLKVGDMLTFDLQGVEIQLPVLSIRRLYWSSMDLNFFIVVSPAALKGAPLSLFATIALPQDKENTLLQQLLGEFPNVTAIPVREMMQTTKEHLNRLTQVVTVMGAFTIAAGVLVLMVSVAASRRRRARESAICRLVGAGQSFMLGATLTEFALLGLLTTLPAVMIAQAITALVIHLLMNDVYQWTPQLTLLSFFAGIFLVVIVGFFGSWRALHRPVMTELKKSVA
ncbi:MAG: ABC transporter permease [Magnetococcales bacterium]|nr:ABC transporter permease [Magnetococcales bacterium]